MKIIIAMIAIPPAVPPAEAKPDFRGERAHH